MSVLVAGDEDVVTGRLPGAAPVTAVLDVVLTAVRRLGAAGVAALEQTRPLPDDAEWRVSVDAARRFTLTVRHGGDWVPHATGVLADDPEWDGHRGFAGASTWPVTDLTSVLCRDGLVPVRWCGVELRPGAVRARAEWDGLTARVWLADAAGLPAGYVHEVVVGPPGPDIVAEHVYRVVHDAVAPTVRAANLTVVNLTDVADPVLAALHATRDGDLVFVIDDSLSCAPVKGFVRSLRLECPERTIRLVVVREGAGRAAVDAAVDASEPELVVSGAALLAPRLEPVTLTGGPILDPEGAVLITGGTGELGRVMAMHVVAAHGIRHLVLVSRRGPYAPGAAELVASLRAAGAHTVRVMAADVADRRQVAAVLDEVTRPLTAVLHLAGVLDPRFVTGQDTARFTRVLAPKVDGARHLHELTLDEPLAAFVLFSSVASVLGAAGQSNYAAACAYLDTLAEHRRARGLVATSVSWGLWEQSDTGMAAYLGEQEKARLRRQGVAALTVRQGCRIFDAAIAQPLPHVVAAALSPAERLPDEKSRLATLHDEAQWRAVVSLVRREVAVVLGAEPGQRQVLSDAGVDSLLALELRNRLTAATGVALPAMLVADHPTPHALARLITTRLAPDDARGKPVAVLGVAGLEPTPDDGQVGEERGGAAVWDGGGFGVAGGERGAGERGAAGDGGGAAAWAGGGFGVAGGGGERGAGEGGAAGDGGAAVWGGDGFGVAGRGGERGAGEGGAAGDGGTAVRGGGGSGVAGGGGERGAEEGGAARDGGGAAVWGGDGFGVAGRGGERGAGERGAVGDGGAAVRDGGGFGVAGGRGERGAGDGGAGGAAVGDGGGFGVAGGGGKRGAGEHGCSGVGDGAIGHGCGASPGCGAVRRCRGEEGAPGSAAGGPGCGVVWAALERAGLVPGSLRGEAVGVFLAGWSGDEVAAWFGFSGPVVTVCGSALVAVHLARVAILRGECTIAIAGGAALLVLSSVEGGVAVLTDSALVGAGAGGVEDLADAVVGRRWADVRGPGARVTVEPRPLPSARAVDGVFPVVVSAADDRGLVQQAARWADWLDDHPGTPIAGVARTSALHRTHFPVRAGVVASSATEAAGALRGLAGGVVAGDRARLVFECAGHSGRWVGIGRELLDGNAAFAATAAECDQAFRSLLGWSVLDALIGDHDLDLDREDVIRPVSFTAQVSVVAALREMGVVPDAAFGSLASAVLAGADGARMVVDGQAGQWETVTARDAVIRLGPVRDLAGLLRIVVDAHAQGYPVDWAAVLPEAALAALPTSLCCTG